AGCTSRRVWTCRWTNSSAGKPPHDLLTSGRRRPELPPARWVGGPFAPGRGRGLARADRGRTARPGSAGRDARGAGRTRPAIRVAAAPLLVVRGDAETGGDGRELRRLRVGGRALPGVQTTAPAGVRRLRVGPARGGRDHRAARPVGGRQH